MNKSYSKIRHIQESNLRLEKRIIEEENKFDIISTIKNNLSTIVNVILSTLPFTLIPRIIYYIASGDYKSVLNKIQEYKVRIESELQKRNIRVSVQDIINNFEKIKGEFLQVLKTEASKLG